MAVCSQRLSLVLILIFTVAVGQDLTPYFRLIDEGQIDRLREELPRLLEQYPDHAGVLFLDALAMERAENAIVAYKKLIQNHPNSPYVDDAVMKIGEYLFARGLYTQSSRELAKVPRLYPDSEHLQRAIDLQINSLLATGERDSAEYYIEFYRSRLQNLDLSYDLGPNESLIGRPLKAAEITPLSEGIKRPPVSSPEPQSTPDEISGENEKSLTLENEIRPFVIQVGAYGSRDNALRQKMLLEQRGYSVELWPITWRGKELLAVQVVRFATRGEAEETGKRLKADLGHSYIVLERPED